jgi:hypothetical protein
MTWRLTHSKGPGRRHETHERRDAVDELETALARRSSSGLAPSNIGVCATWSRSQGVSKSRLTAKAQSRVFEAAS